MYTTTIQYEVRRFSKYKINAQLSRGRRYKLVTFIKIKDETKQLTGAL